MSSSSILWFDYDYEKEEDEDFGLWPLDFRFMIKCMDDENNNSRRYKWPWFVLAAVLLFLALAVLWVSLAVNKVAQERDVNTPVPAGAR